MLVCHKTSSFYLPKQKLPTRLGRGARGSTQTWPACAGARTAIFPGPVTRLTGAPYSRARFEVPAPGGFSMGLGGTGFQPAACSLWTSWRHLLVPVNALHKYCTQIA